MAGNRFRLVNEIFRSAVDIPPEDREEFLRKECRGDVTVRRDVEKLLRSFDGNTSDGSPSFVRPDSGPTPDSDRTPTRIQSAEGDKGSDIDLSPGTVLGRYKVLSKIGSGGMSEVYLAQDTSLQRKVALKLLSPELARDKNSLQRFEHEAFAASGLSHPYILTILEFGKSGEGVVYIAAEYVEGETLDDYCWGESIGVAGKLDLFIQIASALSAAHKAGIVHRDIKPENVIVRPDGLVKVLDFGLAKLTEHRRETLAGDDATTRPMVRTSSGVVMGTTPYMSPEQIRGRDVGARTDIWSLGVVIYQLISGELPFRAETAGDTIASILRSEPVPLSDAAGDCPEELSGIVQRMLSKDTAERYLTADDLAADLEALRDGIRADSGAKRTGLESAMMLSGKRRSTGRTLASVTEDHSIRRFGRFVPGLGVGLLAAAVTILGYLYLSVDTESTGAVPLATREVDSWNGSPGESHSIRARFSPDGKLVAYASTRGGTPSIWLKQLSEEAVPFSSGEEDSSDRSPIFSPDGQRIAFLSIRGGKSGIWSKPTFAGERKLLKALESASGRLVEWSRDGKTIFFEQNADLHSLDVATARFERLTDLGLGAGAKDFAVSGDGKRIAYVATVEGQPDIWVSGRHGKNAARITGTAGAESNLVWSPDGKKIFFNVFDGGRNRAFRINIGNRKASRILFAKEGSEIADISHDGARLVVTSTTSKADLWRVDLGSRSTAKITNDPGTEFWADVSPDGRSIVYQAVPGSDAEMSLTESALFAREMVGADRRRQIAESGYQPRFSPDGKQIAFLFRQDKKANLGVVSTDGAVVAELASRGVMMGGYDTFPMSRVHEQDYDWAPDGTAIAYCAVRDGLSNVWLAKTDGSGDEMLSANDDPGLFFFSPFFLREGNKVAVLGQQRKYGSGRAGFVFSVGVLEDGRLMRVWETESFSSILGWSADSRNLFIRSLKGVNRPGNIRLPGEVEVFRVSVSSGSSELVGVLEQTFFTRVAISPTRGSLAFVSRSDGHDLLKTLNIRNGEKRQILRSEDGNVFFTGLAWSDDERFILFGRQASLKVISMVENFR